MNDEILKFLLTFFGVNKLTDEIYAVSYVQDICIASKVANALGIDTFADPNALVLINGNLVAPNISQADLDAAISGIDAVSEAVQQAVVTKRRSISESYEMAIYELVGTYPKSERESWFKQEEEALAYQADPAAATPGLDALLRARAIVGETKYDLATKILTNARNFTTASMALIGKRHGIELRLDALAADPAATVADINAVSW